MPSSMFLSRFSGENPRGKKALSAVIGGVLLFGMIFTVAFGYFYTVNQDQQYIQSQIKQNNVILQQKNQENLYLVANVNGGTLGFSVNNSGIAATLVSYFVINALTGQILAYKSGSPSSASACPATNAQVACSLNQGKSTAFTTTIAYFPGNNFEIKVLTSRGNTIVGAYPTQSVTLTSINSQVASGLGSLTMLFSSFKYYTYSSTSPKYVVNLGNPQTASITPYNKQIVLSAQVTNNDPSGGTIIVDAHADLWTFVSCAGGCGSQSLIFFYIVNVAANGTITSSSQGSYTPIQIPYGSTQTLYFASANDISLGNFGPQLINDQVSEHDVFMIFSGTLVTAKNDTLYAQNLPFAATLAADNIAQWSFSPTSCSNGSSSTFSLVVTNSQNSVAGTGINQIVMSVGSFSGTTYGTPPTGWSCSGTTTITCTASSSAYYITPGNSKTFTWSGTAPIVHGGTVVTFPSTAKWPSGSGTIVSQPIDTGCYVD
jgi:hypothetical protein